MVPPTCRLRAGATITTQGTREFRSSVVDPSLNRALRAIARCAGSTPRLVDARARAALELALVCGPGVLDPPMRRRRIIADEAALAELNERVWTLCWPEARLGL